MAINKELGVMSNFMTQMCESSEECCMLLLIASFALIALQCAAASAPSKTAKIQMNSLATIDGECQK